MKPFIKTGSGEPSWSATLLVCYFFFYVAIYMIGIWAPDPYCKHAQSAWSAIDVGLISLLANYVARKGTKTYERLKNGASATSAIQDLVANEESGTASAGNALRAATTSEAQDAE